MSNILNLFIDPLAKPHSCYYTYCIAHGNLYKHMNSELWPLDIVRDNCLFMLHRPASPRTFRRPRMSVTQSPPRMPMATPVLVAPRARRPTRRSGRRTRSRRGAQRRIHNCTCAALIVAQILPSVHLMQPTVASEPSCKSVAYRTHFLWLPCRTRSRRARAVAGQLLGSHLCCMCDLPLVFRYASHLNALHCRAVLSHLMASDIQSCPLVHSDYDRGV